VVDLGTLTGEIITTLGHDTAGLWCNDDDLRAALRAAADAAGEPVWPMPLNAEHRRLIRESFHADLLNRNLEGPGKSCQCAAFLEPFAVGEHRPKWAHLDIAGPVHVTAADPPYVPGPTGYGTRLLVRWLRGLA
jgi:leucyl aminopeptidase